VIVYDLDINGIAILPSKANTPLIVDANAVLAGTFALKRFKVIRRRNAQIIQGLSIVDLP